MRPATPQPWVGVTLLIWMSLIGACGAHVNESVRDPSYTHVVNRVVVIVLASGMKEDFNAGAVKALVHEANVRRVDARGYVIHNQGELGQALAAATKAGAQAALISRVDTVMTQYGVGVGAHMNVTLMELAESGRLIWRSNIYNPWPVDHNHPSFARTVFGELQKERLIAASARD